jgi:methylmalonyl-CoA mutase
MGNILEQAVQAARVRATLGEISDALRSAFGEHVAEPQIVHDIYGTAYRDDPEYQTLARRLQIFAADKSTPPRILIAKLGQDGHDRGAKVIASAFGDIGFDIFVSPMFQTPAEAANMAVEHKVQIVGVSSLAAGHKTLLPQLVSALKENGGKDIIVVCGGIVPRGDYAVLQEAGVAAIFGPGTNILEAANGLLDILEGRRRNL